MSAIREFYEKYIANTEHDALVSIARLYLCNVRRTPGKILRQRRGSKNRRVYISTKALKHIYDRHIFDKQTPKDFSVILEHVVEIIKYPDGIYRNVKEKRGDFLFAKEIAGKKRVIVIEIVSYENDTAMEIVSAYRTDEKYLKKFDLLWSGRTATPPS